MVVFGVKGGVWKSVGFRSAKAISFRGAKGDYYLLGNCCKITIRNVAWKLVGEN